MNKDDLHNNLVEMRLLQIYRRVASNWREHTITTTNIYDNLIDINSLEFLINDKSITFSITKNELFSDEATFKLVLDRICIHIKNQL